MRFWALVHQDRFHNYRLALGDTMLVVMYELARRVVDEGIGGELGDKWWTDVFYRFHVKMQRPYDVDILDFCPRLASRVSLPWPRKIEFLEHLEYGCYPPADFDDRAGQREDRMDALRQVYPEDAPLMWLDFNVRCMKARGEGWQEDARERSAEGGHA
jgi:hypothetical protein